MSEQLLLNGLKEWGVVCDTPSLEKLRSYHALLLEWNRKFNLMSAKMTGLIYRELFLDSLSAVRFGQVPPGCSCVDIGTGNGVPGIVLAICVPDIKMTLVESIGKKITFLQAIVQDLGLDNVSIWHGRAEELAPDRERRFDRVTFKAFGKLAKCMEMGLPFLKKNGIILSYRGTDAQTEVENTKARYNGFTFDMHGYLLPEDDRGRTVIAVHRRE